MFTADVVEAIDVMKEGASGVGTGDPTVAPEQFGFEGFEEGLDGGYRQSFALRLVVTFSFTTH